VHIQRWRSDGVWWDYGQEDALKRLLPLAFLLCAASCFGATGDINWLYVEDNGTYVRVKVENITTNGNFNFHLVTNTLVSNINGTNFTNWTFTPSSQTPYLLLNSPGFTTNSSPLSNNVPRKVYLTKQLRLPYPNSTAGTYTDDKTNISGDCVFRAALDFPVYVNDWGITAFIPASTYSNNNAATALTVTNNSTCVYPKVIAHIADRNRVPTNGVYTIEVEAVQAFGTNGMPVALVQVTATGETSTHVETGTTSAYVQSGRDGQPVYQVPLNLSVGAGFTRGEIVDINATVWPWVGNALAKYDTTTDAGSFNYQGKKSFYTIMDRMIAVVDLAAGTSAGWASTNQADADAHPLDSITRALSAIAATNNAKYSLNRTDGGDVQLKAAGYQTGKYGAQAMSSGYFTLGPHSSATRDNVIFTNFVTSQSQYAYQRYYNVTFQRPGNGFIVFAATGNYMLMEKVNFLDGGTSWYSGDNTAGGGSVIDFIDCYTTNSYFSRFGNDALTHLIRNCTYSNLFGSQAILGSAQCVLGATVVSNNSAIWLPRINNESNVVLMNIKNVRGSGAYVTQKPINNLAFIQDHFEIVAVSASPIWEISSFNTTNILMWNNSWEGQRFNHENDWVTPNNQFAINWNMKNNIWSARGDHRADIRAANGAITGWWTVGYSIGWRNNWSEGISSSGDEDFFGFSSSTATNNTGIDTAHPMFAGYQNQQSHDGGVQTNGYGDYHLVADAPAYLMLRNTELLIPWDINGKPRTGNDPPGAYAFGPYTILQPGAVTILQPGATTVLQP
jgi:hypothetical protein